MGEDQAEKIVRTDPVLVKALRSAHAMIKQDADDLPVLDQGPASPYRRRLDPTGVVWFAWRSSPPIVARDSRRAPAG